MYLVRLFYIKFPCFLITLKLSFYLKAVICENETRHLSAKSNVMLKFLALLAAKRWVRDDSPNLNTEDVILCCLVWAVPQLWGCEG
jgi:hypothetical protein